MHSDSQLIRILTVALILGGILFIFSAQIAHLKSKQDLTSGETIYIQADEEVVSVQDNELTEDYAEIITNEIDIPQIKDDTSSELNWADTSTENTNFKQLMNCLRLPNTLALLQKDPILVLKNCNPLVY